jgi:hypothetical protein
MKTRKIWDVSLILEDEIHKNGKCLTQKQVEKLLRAKLLAAGLHIRNVIAKDVARKPYGSSVTLEFGQAASHPVPYQGLEETRAAGDES